jgi:transcriptional regulator of heat shock response
MPDRELTKKEQLTLQKELLQLKAQNNRLTRTTAKLLATLSGYVAFTACPSKNEFSEFGLKSLLENAKMEDLDEICHLAETLDCIDEKCEDLMRAVSSGDTQIFIGEENPIFKSKNHSMIISQYEQNGERGIVALIGPKNMKYEKNKSLIDYVKKILGGTGLFFVIIYFV